MIFAIDPGPEFSGLVVWDGSRVFEASTDLANADVLKRVDTWARSAVPGFDDCLAIERVACYGNVTGEKLIETIRWSGRFEERWKGLTSCHFLSVRFAEVALHHCGRRAIKESLVKQALLDRFGPVGTKAAPGLFYSVHGHAWSALALAVCVFDRLPNLATKTA